MDDLGRWIRKPDSAVNKKCADQHAHPHSLTSIFNH